MRGNIEGNAVLAYTCWVVYCGSTVVHLHNSDTEVHSGGKNTMGQYVNYPIYPACCKHQETALASRKWEFTITYEDFILILVEPYCKSHSVILLFPVYIALKLIYKIVWYTTACNGFPSALSFCSVSNTIHYGHKLVNDNHINWPWHAWYHSCNTALCTSFVFVACNQSSSHYGAATCGSHPWQAEYTKVRSPSAIYIAIIV